MIYAEIQRLFVSHPDTGQIVGVLSLSDAARLRSGSCQACVSSRIKVEEDTREALSENEYLLFHCR